MKLFQPDYNLFAVSLLLKETALNTEQTLSHSMIIDKDDILDLDPRVEDNSDELTGKEEPDAVYRLGNIVSKSLNFNKAKPQDFLLAYGYGLGTVATSAYGTGYKHLISGVAGPVLPGFTAAQRLGKTIFKRRFASMFVDTISTVFAKDSWAKCVVGLKGTGKYSQNMVKETITAYYDATSLALAANAVQGANAQERLDNVHQIRVLVPTSNEWVEVVYSAVSSATPAVITIAAPGGTHTQTTYEVLYVPTEPAWCSFPSRVIEPPLRVTDLVVKIGGKWNGTSFLGGRTVDAEVESIEHTLNNQMDIEFRVGGTGAYANYAFKQGRKQTLKFDRQMREFILQQRIEDNEYLGVYAKATGAVFETGKNYYVELIFPRCTVLKAPISVKDKVLAEAGDIQVLEDDTYGSIIVTVANKIATCAA